MRTLIITALAILAIQGTTVKAQVDFSKYKNPELAERIYHNHAVGGLNACPYELAVQPGPDSKAPRGYKPFYISHYGRHGSRSGFDQNHYDALIEVLRSAKEDGILTASGDSLLYEIEQVNLATNNMDGRLTLRGQREHKALAERMYKRYRRVFRRGGRNIRAISSTVPRCLVSMAAFTNSLSELDPRLDIVMDCGSEIQKEVTNDSPEETRARRYQMTDSLKALINLDYSEPMCRIFSDTAAARKLVGDEKEFFRRIYRVARITRSFDFGFDTFRFLPFDAIYAWAEYYNAYMYLGQCNSIPFGDKRMETTVPLIRNIVRQADDALASGEVAADLRFGHDYPLMALCSYLGIEGIGERYDADGARAHFNAADYSPFAGNLQMVFYRSRKAGKPVLVKFLMNERETGIIGLEPVQGPYYEWEKVREKISR